MFFSEEKNQKTFTMAPNSQRVLSHSGAAPGAKDFASFFKKKRFLKGSTSAHNSHKA
jgi:hypothetical protein